MDHLEDDLGYMALAPLLSRKQPKKKDDNSNPKAPEQQSDTEAEKPNQGKKKSLAIPKEFLADITRQKSESLLSPTTTTNKKTKSSDKSPKAAREYRHADNFFSKSPHINSASLQKVRAKNSTKIAGTVLKKTSRPKLQHQTEIPVTESIFAPAATPVFPEHKGDKLRQFHATAQQQTVAPLPASKPTVPTPVKTIISNEQSRQGVAPTPVQPKPLDTSSMDKLPVDTRKTRKVKINIWWVAAPLVILFLSVAGWFLVPEILSVVKGGDVEIADISDLVLPHQTIPDLNNSYFDIIQIPALDTVANQLKQLTDYSDSNNWNDATASQIVSHNLLSLALFDQAANKYDFQIPSFASVNSRTPSSTNGTNLFLEAAQLEAVNAISEAKQGKRDLALENAAKINEFGHQILNSNVPIQIGQMALSIEQLGSETILQLLSSGTSTPFALEYTLNSLLSSAGNQTGYQDLFKYAFTQNQIALEQAQTNVPQYFSHNIQAESLAKYRYYFKPNQTANMFSALAHTQVAASANLCQLPAVDSELQHGLQDYSRVNWKSRFQNNALGELYFYQNAKSFSTLLTQECYNDLLINVAILEVAMEKYQIQVGSLPDTLDGLNPAYIPVTPLDPFNHQELQYDPVKKIIYSVGPSGKNLGGQPGTNWMTAQNPTFIIGF